MANFDIYTVTGTKGKTTVVTVLAKVLRELTHKNVLHVTTLGHYINGEQKSTLKDSLSTWGLVSSVSPGRYLYECLHFEPGSSAVLEASLGSSSLAGLGYGRHKVGIFLNVFKDHIGNSKRINSQKDIAKAKQFVFTRVKKGGWVVYNNDDRRVVSSLSVVSSRTSRISFGLTKPSNEKFHISLEGDMVSFSSPDGEQLLLDIKDIPWTFNGAFKPSIYNLLAVIAGVIAGADGKVPTNLAESLKNTKLDEYGGRLTLFKNDKNVHILADYAHEEESLQAVATLARQKVSDAGKVIGVVRLAYDRTDAHIIQTAKAIATSYDAFIVYDKIDGYNRMPKDVSHQKFTQGVGKISEVFSAALQKYVKKGTPVETILREDLALQRAAKLANPGDVVVHIVNDDVRQSIDWVKEFFSAELE